MDNELEDLLSRLPFLSYGRAYNIDYVGVLNARSKSYVSMYLIDDIDDVDLLKELLLLAEAWWWECNHNIPISIFFSNDMKKFECYRKIFLSKDFTLISGTVSSLSNIASKRIKRCVKLLKKA